MPTNIVSHPYPSISMIPLTTPIRFDRRTVSGESLDDVLEQLEGARDIYRNLVRAVCG
ncbi:MAG: hypothetical protein ACN6PJ_01160 [Achromobacter sp.]|uniref:hypothetical protein n=1 Tax=Achromobacter sp. TaxID=134375 RepID=UPI003D02C6EF